MRHVLPLVLLLSSVSLYAQLAEPRASASAVRQTSAQMLAELPNAPDVRLQQSSSNSASAAHHAPQAATGQSETASPPPQPKRILGLMPNYRAVSAGVKPPPPTPKEAFKIATNQSFDYSAFVFVGLTSMIAEGDNSHPALGKGVPGFWAYSWRGFLDKTDGNYWVVWALPTVMHEDERYYALGRGPILKRAVYAASRILITPDYNGHNTINGAELLGKGIAQGISMSYYPSSDRTVSAFTEKYGWALVRDVTTNTFREFWPDIAVHVLHRHP